MYGDEDSETYAERIEQLLTQALELARDDQEDHGECEDGPLIERVSTFADDGILTTNNGLVVRFMGGGEAQITIVVSQYPAAEGGENDV